jgi:CheY-like chemotaxis protein
MSLSEQNHASITILVAHDDTELRCALVDQVRGEGYHVFESPDLPTMIETVLTQTRPIHLVLTDASTDKRYWAARLQNHRPKMVVWFVESWQEAEISDILTPELVLTKVREFFDGRQGSA